MNIISAKGTVKGSESMFTGDVNIDEIARDEEPSRIRVSLVHFTPGARTAWHSHALGQALNVTEGIGLVQSRGGEAVHIHAGQTIYTPPDEWHWHGATPEHLMSHLSITEAVGEGQGPESEWGDHVTDEEYGSK